MKPPRRSRWLRWLGIAVAAAGIAVISLAGFVALRFEPADLIALVRTKVIEHTGRELAIEGAVGYELSWLPTVSAEGVRLHNAAWGSRPQMLTAQRIEVQIALLPLLAHRIEIRRLVLIEPNVLLEVDREGKGNWQFDSPRPNEPAANRDARKSALDIRSVRIENATIAYRDARSGRNLVLTLDKLDIAGGGTIDLKGAGTLNTVPVELEAVLPAGAFARSLDKGTITLVSPSLRLHAQGVFPWHEGSERTDFAFALDIGDWAAAAKLAQIDFPSWPRLKAQGVVRMQDGGVTIDNIDATLGKSRGTGHLRIARGAQERTLDVRLDAEQLDLTQLLGRSEKKKRADGRIFSPDPLPLAWLPDLIGKATAHVTRLTLRDGHALDQVGFTAMFDHGRVSADPVRIDIEGKELRLRVHADAASGKTLKLDLALEGQGIPLGALGALLDLTGTPERSPTDVSLRLSANGNSMRALMASATGDLRMDVGRGRVRNRVVDLGADVSELLKAVNPAYASDPYTELKCAAVRLPLRQGVAHVSNGIAMETSKVDIIGGGTIDLRNETLDLGFRTKAASGFGIGLGSLADLGRLRGTLAHPQVQVDLAGAAKTATQIGLAAATGGLSLIASGLLADHVPNNPCQVALGARGEKSDTAPSIPSVVDSVVGGIKKIFGR